jgi:hypothetical protein
MQAIHHWIQLGRLYLRDVHVWVLVSNATDQPIWDVAACISLFVQTGDGNRLKSADSEDERVIIEPRETVRIPVHGYTIAYNRFPIAIDFRDNAGAEWQRD